MPLKTGLILMKINKAITYYKIKKEMCFCLLLCQAEYSKEYNAVSNFSKIGVDEVSCKRVTVSYEGV